MAASPPRALKLTTVITGANHTHFVERNYRYIILSGDPSRTTNDAGNIFIARLRSPASLEYYTEDEHFAISRFIDM